MVKELHKDSETLIYLSVLGANCAFILVYAFCVSVLITHINAKNRQSKKYCKIAKCLKKDHLIQTQLILYIVTVK